MWANKRAVLAAEVGQSGAASHCHKQTTQKYHKEFHVKKNVGRQWTHRWGEDNNDDDEETTLTVSFMFRSSICPYFWVKCEMQLECSIFFSMPQKENCVIFFQLHHPIHLYVLLCDGGTTFRNFPVFRFVFVSSSPVCLPACSHFLRPRVCVWWFSW